MSLCILLSTCDRYRPLAEFTRGELARQWPGHPPIFVSGLSAPAEGGLHFSGDFADWMAVTRDACAQLIARGFSQCHLVLDDHPPFGPCHAEHLGSTLPRFLRERGGVCVQLLGWGQKRPRRGERLAFFDMEKSDADYLWKFSLHPALWDIAKLAEILDRLKAGTGAAERTCWKFERRSGAGEAELPAGFRNASYRVSGARMLAKTYPLFPRIRRRIERGALDVYRFLVRIAAGQAARDRLDLRIDGLFKFYDGPYPLFWSGVMKKGKLNHDLLFALRVHGQREMIERLTRVAASL